MSSSPDPVSGWKPTVFVPAEAPGGEAAARPWTPASLESAAANRAQLGWLAPLTEVGSGAVDGTTLHAAELEEAFARGQREGRAEGEAAVRAELAEAGRVLREAAGQLGLAREEILGDVRANVVALALAAAKKMVQDEITARPEVLERQIHRGLDLVRPDSPVEIRVHPDDLARLQRHQGETVEDETLSLRWTADPDLEPGGFLLEGVHRIVDGRLDEAMRILYERLTYE